nr:hypothetical protein [candidate division Zixibacteria bacterium]NIT59541.1 hypothetical protein [Fodinibius sp.]NIW47027.1 hypothetical protein [Gammaproteobacteria bacterium]NIS47554.1 hypothetical protein [candidate division Zixibacteria bacterium]NIU15645.1 hypothetical protein [candidate division Zixibacteria bacterium]
MQKRHTPTAYLLSLRYAVVARIALFCAVILTGFFMVSDLHAQSIYQGPAFGSIPGGAQVSTTQFEDASQNIIPAGQKIFNPFWDEYDPPLISDEYNSTPSSAPQGSNEFIDPAAVPTLDQTSDAPGVVIDFQGSTDPGNYIPPDPHLAVGPNHVIVCDNSRFIIFDKQGNRLL